MGSVKRFDAAKRCGFIRVEGQQDVFVGTRENPGLSLSAGYAVEFDVVTRRGQPHAVRVRILNDPEIIKPKQLEPMPEYKGERRSLDIAALDPQAAKILEGYFLEASCRGIEIKEEHDDFYSLFWARNVVELGRKALARTKFAPVRSMLRETIV